MHLEERDVVRVVRLRAAERPYDGTEGVLRAPRLGDEGTVVQAAAKGDASATVMVECCDADGGTIWLAEFAADELELTDASLMDKRQRAARHPFGWALTGILAFVGCAIGLFTGDPPGLAPIWLVPGLLLALPMFVLNTADLGRTWGQTPGLSRLQRVSCLLLRGPMFLVGVAGVVVAALFVDLLASNGLGKLDSKMDFVFLFVFLGIPTFLGIGGSYLLIKPLLGQRK